jgi:hypothetical protein
LFILFYSLFAFISGFLAVAVSGMKIGSLISGLTLFIVPTLALVGALSASIFVASNWQVWTEEHRPALLADAHWDDAASARQFLTRFPRGSSEADLLRWLQSNQFGVNRTRGSAQRFVRSIPCEEIAIAWTSSAGRIKAARATVSDAGCLTG